MNNPLKWAIWVMWVTVAGCSGPQRQCEEWVEPQKDEIAFSPGPGRLTGRPEVPPARPPFDFSATDAAFLEEVARGAFDYLWTRVDPATGLVYDRTPGPVVSVAGVGFQLAALPVGVERGWVTRAEAEARARQVLGALVDPALRSTHEGLHFHFLDGPTGQPTTEEFEVLASTADAAILHAGAIVAGSYFEGEVARLCGALLGAANWRAFMQSDPPPHPHTLGALSLGWKPDDPTRPSGPGSLLPYHWLDAGCEARLVAFIGVCAPDPDHRLPVESYYGLRREPGLTPVGRDLLTHNPYAGALFTQVYAHLFVDYAAMGVDDPERFGVGRRLRVDWWENSRRYAWMHRDMISAAGEPTSPGVIEGRRIRLWGLSACDTPVGYRAYGLSPRHACLRGGRMGWDVSGHLGLADWGDGTLSPSAAGMTVIFEPREALAVMRRFRALTDRAGEPLCWRDPAKGGFGFVSGVNMVGPDGLPWAARDTLGIDQGALLLAIENARTGLVWRLFHAHPNVQAGMERLGLSLGRE